ncbi:hypothetical protein MTBBW1_1330013 [Desulfamplus magnetovallimortis]|uniref:Uncharacterized protein n=1 Tax=Desulfamplus magnetovallimortis TaxID=1246637 RepID=A0A1W1H7H9_9BACT|nr:hypothetical protein [Desulfamplus magnetovallimortis]SLM28427.1 hypothetical protein MTBBW1_1330013 [Desulfamplus magnetovallimortis]
MPTGMIDNVRGRSLPPEWLEQIGGRPDQTFQIIIKVKPGVERSMPLKNRLKPAAKNELLPRVPKEVKNRALKALLEDSENDFDDLDMDEIKNARRTKDPDFYNFFD